MAKERQSLNLDLESLFPGEPLTIGNSTITIRPLGFEQIAILVKKLSGMGSILSEKGVTWDNYMKPENLFQIASVLLVNFPEVLEEASNINIDDLKGAPLEVIVQIVEKTISVNLKSKEALEKNFKSLTMNFLPQAPKKDQGKMEKKTK